jgi:hypothetical protein
MKLYYYVTSSLGSLDQGDILIYLEQQNTSKVKLTREHAVLEYILMD